jgi:hypothetical protein
LLAFALLLVLFGGSEFTKDKDLYIDTCTVWVLAARKLKQKACLTKIDFQK